MSGELSEVAKMVQWIARDEQIWEALCWNGETMLPLEEISEALEEMISQEMYQLAFLVLAKLRWSGELSAVIQNAIGEWIRQPIGSAGPLSKCAEALAKIIKANGLKNREIPL